MHPCPIQSVGMVYRLLGREGSLQGQRAYINNILQSPRFIVPLFKTRKRWACHLRRSSCLLTFKLLNSSQYGIVQGCDAHGPRHVQVLQVNGTKAANVSREKVRCSFHVLNHCSSSIAFSSKLRLFSAFHSFILVLLTYNFIAYREKQTPMLVSPLTPWHLRFGWPYVSFGYKRTLLRQAPFKPNKAPQSMTTTFQETGFTTQAK
jgi:hypothetical protein